MKYLLVCLCMLCGVASAKPVECKVINGDGTRENRIVEMSIMRKERVIAVNSLLFFVKEHRVMYKDQVENIDKYIGGKDGFFAQTGRNVIVCGGFEMPEELKGSYGFATK